MIYQMIMDGKPILSHNMHNILQIKILSLKMLKLSHVNIFKVVIFVPTYTTLMILLACFSLYLLDSKYLIIPSKRSSQRNYRMRNEYLLNLMPWEIYFINISVQHYSNVCLFLSHISWIRYCLWRAYLLYHLKSIK